MECSAADIRDRNWVAQEQAMDDGAEQAFLPVGTVGKFVINRIGTRFTVTRANTVRRTIRVTAPKIQRRPEWRSAADRRFRRARVQGGDEKWLALGV
jgi:hypothetical protein